MKKILFENFFLIVLSSFNSHVSTIVIIWIFQAVNFLDIIVEDGRDYTVYVTTLF